MTVLNTEARLGMSTGQMPRVNLLPPEIAETALLRKVQVGLGAAVAAAVVVVGLLTVSAAHGVSTAEDSVNAANVQNTKLTADVAKYNNVTAVYDAARAAQQQLTDAMGQEVRYSQLMHDLSLSVPSTVWLKSLAYTQTAPAATTTGAVAPIGSVTFTGIGFSHDDLALWLESVASQKAYSDPFFSASTESLLDPTHPIVTFTGTMNETPAALSGRYTKPLGG